MLCWKKSQLEFDCLRQYQENNELTMKVDYEPIFKIVLLLSKTEIILGQDTK